MTAETVNGGSDELINSKSILSTFDEITASSDRLSNSISQLLSKDKLAPASDEGISLLNVKNQLLCEYLSNLAFTILSKCSGKSIENSPAIDRLVEIRTVIERIRPLEQKLKYQINKLVKIALTGALSTDDASQFRANPSNLMNDEDESDESDDEQGGKLSLTGPKVKDGIYVPPRLAAVEYDGKETQLSKQKELIENAKKRALSSSVVQKMQEEYLDAPTEIVHSSGFRNKISKEERERMEYEETHYTRLPVTKKDKILAKQRAALSSIGLDDELATYGDLKSLGDEFSKLSKKSKKFKGKGKGKGKGTGSKKKKTFFKKKRK